MKRYLDEELLLWKDDLHRLPLIVRGARQVGKTYTIEQFGKKAFVSTLFVNFELHPEFKSCFENLDPKVVLNNLELITNQRIIPGETLLFLDEIQECPQAIAALRYFKEQVPSLHIIGAGSLLEFTLNDAQFSYPVGRVQFMYMAPLSFCEFLLALGHAKLLEALKEMSLDHLPSNAVHEQLLKFVRIYFFVGGMPAVVNLYRESQSFLKCGRLQEALFQAYKTDFGKYAAKTQHKYLQRFYQKAPLLVTKHFQYSKIDAEMRPRDLKVALSHLSHAGLIHQIYATSANGLPLAASVNEKKFKIIFLDIGLLQSALKLKSSTIWDLDLHQINEGALAEQFVGQELLAYQDVYHEKQLFFWERQKKGSEAEVDYIISLDSTIIPIEVKAGAAGRLKSLKNFIRDKKGKLGLRVSRAPLSYEGNVLSIPFYLISEIDRILK